jgi:hypothetical protein
VRLVIKIIGPFNKNTKRRRRRRRETLHKLDLAIIAANPIVFKQMVLPPVLGPVITKTRVLWSIKKSTGTG